MEAPTGVRLAPGARPQRTRAAAPRTIALVLDLGGLLRAIPPHAHSCKRINIGHIHARDGDRKTIFVCLLFLGRVDTHSHQHPACDHWESTN